MEEKFKNIREKLEKLIKLDENFFKEVIGLYIGEDKKEKKRFELIRHF